MLRKSLVNDPTMTGKIRKVVASRLKNYIKPPYSKSIFLEEALLAREKAEEAGLRERTLLLTSVGTNGNALCK